MRQANVTGDRIYEPISADGKYEGDRYSSVVCSVCYAVGYSSSRYCEVRV